MSAFAFTFRAKQRLPRIVSPVWVSLPEPDQQFESTTKFRALWDTGATGSVITPSVARKLGLIATGRAQHTGVNGVSETNTYVVDIYLQKGFKINTIVTESGNHEMGFDVIIGMNIITLGDFSMTNVNQETVVSFRIPSQQTIDYVQESRPKTGRNDPCFCGSGKKYKLCHGK